MAILKIRDENGVVHEIVALKGEPGEKGKDGNVSFTDADKEELVNMVLAALPNGDEVAY